jgi:glycosyltransferase involved in cell wall biosynthesis
VSEWIVTAPAPAGRCDGIGDYAALLASSLSGRVPIKVVVPGTDVLPAPDDVSGVLYQYSPSYRSAAITRWLDAVSAHRRPVVVTVHEYWPPLSLLPHRVVARWRLRRHLMALANQATALVVTQEIYARELREAGVTGGRPIAVIPVGSNIRRAPGDAPRDGGVVMFGQPAALQPRVLAAVARWIHESDDRPLLTWMGRSEAEMQDAWRSAVGTPPDRVTFIGGADEQVVSGILQRATMGLAHYEDGVSGKRSTLAALLQHGVPAVATIGIATDSWLKTGEGLAAVPDGDPDAFVQMVDRLWRDAAARERLSYAARALYEAHMDWSRIASAYAALMTTLMKDPR